MKIAARKITSCTIYVYVQCIYVVNKLAIKEKEEECLVTAAISILKSSS